MNRRNNVRRFVFNFVKDKVVDLDLLEQQLHSLYKLKNINFDETSFFNDLNHCNLRATTLELAKKSFIKAITITLESQSILLEDFNISTIEFYSSYVLKMILDKDFIARNLRKEIREGEDNVTGKRMNLAQRAFRLPLAVFSYEPRNYFFNKEKLTKSAAYKKTLDDLMFWEKDIIERLMAQLSDDCVL